MPKQIVVRASGDPRSVLADVRRAINAVSPQLVVTAMATLDDRTARSVADQRFRATLCSLFGATALALATVGLYGLVTRRTADRRREFGVRVALGARPVDVRRLVVGDMAVVILLGLAVGLPAAFAAAHVAKSLLFGVTSTSLHVFVLSSAILAVVALAATLLPARRASRENPILALRD
jgi:ABC-type antimicrobial peptide transport system permease subunit